MQDARDRGVAGGADARRGTPPWVALAILLPKFLVQGYIVVTLVYDWRAAGASATTLSGLLAIGILPLLLSLLLAPLADAALGPKRWWAMGVIGTLVCLGALIALPFGPTTLPAIFALVFLARLFGNITNLALDIVVASTVAPHRKGRANAWALSGGYVGQAIGGGGGLWWHQHGGTHIAAFGLLLAMTAACAGAVTRIGPDLRETARRQVASALRATLADVWAFFRIGDGLRLATFCMLPVGLGAMSDLWVVFAGHWHAGPRSIVLLTGGVVELATLAGIAAGGLIAGRGAPIRTFFAWATVSAAVVLVIAVAPEQPLTMNIGAIVYAFLFGLTQIVSLSVIYQLIGTSSGASKVSICTVLLNVPVMIVTAADGWIGDRLGVPAVLIGEAVLTFLALGAFLLMFPRSLRRPVPGGGHASRLAAR